MAPVVGTAVLESAGWTGSAMEGPVTAVALCSSYRLAVLLPVVCGSLQLLAWTQFDLSGDRLRLVAAALGRPVSSSHGASHATAEVECSSRDLGIGSRDHTDEVHEPVLSSVMSAKSS